MSPGRMRTIGVSAGAVVTSQSRDTCPPSDKSRNSLQRHNSYKIWHVT